MVGKKNELDARGCQKNFQEIHLALVTNVFLRRETDIKFVVWTTRRTAWFKYLSARVNFPHTHCLWRVVAKINRSLAIHRWMSFDSFINKKVDNKRGGYLKIDVCRKLFEKSPDLFKLFELPLSEYRAREEEEEKEEKEEKQAFWVNGKFYGKIVARS